MMGTVNWSTFCIVGHYPRILCGEWDIQRRKGVEQAKVPSRTVQMTNVVVGSTLLDDDL